MTPQERDVIAGIFDRLKQVSNQPRDPEAEKLIAERLAQQPYAPYAMAQAVYVQEQALLTMQAQVEQLQAQVQQLQSQPQPATGGFLSSLFGGGAPAQPAPAQAVPPPVQRGPVPHAGIAAPGMMPRQGQPEQAAGPWGAAQQRQGGGFMATALTTAAGVAGGMVLGNMLMNALGGSKPATDPSAAPAAAAPADSAAAAAPEAAMEPASYDDPGMFDEGGGGDDWA